VSPVGRIVDIQPTAGRARSLLTQPPFDVDEWLTVHLRAGIDLEDDAATAMARRSPRLGTRRWSPRH
jgi:hypothetical protein